MQNNVQSYYKVQDKQMNW